MEDKMRDFLSRTRWLGHSSFKLAGTKAIYIDPWKLPDGIGGDGAIVLVTHDHHDHCSPTDIKKALGKGGEVLAAECCRSKYPTAAHYTLAWMTHRVQG